MPQNIYTTFREFLRDNGCEQQFDRAFCSQCRQSSFDEVLADLLVIDEAFFARCFDWNKTPEGRQFWRSVDNKWWSQYSLPAKSKK